MRACAHSSEQVGQKVLAVGGDARHRGSKATFISLAKLLTIPDRALVCGPHITRLLSAHRSNYTLRYGEAVTGCSTVGAKGCHPGLRGGITLIQRSTYRSNEASTRDGPAGQMDPISEDTHAAGRFWQQSAGVRTQNVVQVYQTHSSMWPLLTLREIRHLHLW